jgi:sugar phosphate permease
MGDQARQEAHAQRDERILEPGPPAAPRGMIAGDDGGGSVSEGRRRGIHYGWIVLAATFVAVAAAAGIRGSFGVYVKPLEADFGWDRAVISGVAALSLLCFGVAQPFIGRLIDRHGPRSVLAGSLLALGLGVFATASVQQLWQLYLSYGILVSLAAGGPSMAPISAIAARWFETPRALVIGQAM